MKIGILGLLAASLAGPRGKVVTVEPEPEVAPIILDEREPWHYKPKRKPWPYLTGRPRCQSRKGPSKKKARHDRIRNAHHRMGKL